jgi:hypothetical protein
MREGYAQGAWQLFGLLLTLLVINRSALIGE